MLHEQRQQQEELLSNVRSLEPELTLLRHQNSGSAVVADNGADVPNLQLQMLQIMRDSSREVQSLKQDRQSYLLRTQLQSHVIPPNPIAASPVWSASACVGFPTPVHIATPVKQKHEQPSKQYRVVHPFVLPSRLPHQNLQHHRPPQLEVEVAMEDHQVDLVDHQVDPRVQ